MIENFVENMIAFSGPKPRTLGDIAEIIAAELRRQLRTSDTEDCARLPIGGEIIDCVALAAEVVRRLGLGK